MPAVNLRKKQAVQSASKLDAKEFGNAKHPEIRARRKTTEKEENLGEGKGECKHRRWVKREHNYMSAFSDAREEAEVAVELEQQGDRPTKSGRVVVGACRDDQDRHVELG